MHYQSVGLITRKCDLKNDKSEQSVIDFVIVSADLQKHVVSFEVDEAKKCVLTNITRENNKVVRKESDHNTMFTKFELKWSKNVNKNKIEIFNFKDKEGQDNFRALTTNNTILSSIFDSEKDVDILAKKFLKRLKGMLH